MGTGESERARAMIKWMESERMKIVRNTMIINLEIDYNRPQTDEARKMTMEESKELLRNHIKQFNKGYSRIERRCSPGVRTKLMFVPTDEVLIEDFLKPKVFNLPGPCVALIPEFEVFSTEPWNLPIIYPGEEFHHKYVTRKNERYFFQRRVVDHSNNDHLIRRAGDGYWEWFRRGIEITNCCGHLVGWKCCYAFKRNDNPTEQTGWIVEAYYIPHERNGAKVWMLCKIYESKKGRKRVHSDDADGCLLAMGSIENECQLVSGRLPTEEIQAHIVTKGVKMQDETGNILDGGMNSGAPGTNFCKSSRESNEESASSGSSSESSDDYSESLEEDWMESSEDEME